MVDADFFHGQFALNERPNKIQNVQKGEDKIQKESFPAPSSDCTPIILAVSLLSLNGRKCINSQSWMAMAINLIFFSTIVNIIASSV